MIRRQEVPGYTGHIRGMVNKDSHSKSYAKVTAQLYSKKHPIEVNNTPKGRFSSTQRDEYRLSNNRRFAQNKEMVSRRDYEDYSKFINETHGNRKELMTQGISSLTQRSAKSSLSRERPLDILTVRTATASGGRPFFNMRNS